MIARPLRARCAALVMLAVACRQPAPAAPEGLTLQDPEGKAVVVTHLPVRRIVTTMQSVTEWLVLLGAENTLVARTDYDRQPELRALPSIGGGLNPSPERILKLAPDIIIGWRDRSSVDLKHALEPFRIPVVSFETTDTADVLRNLHLLGTLVGHEAKADSLAVALRAALADVKRTACTPGDTLHDSVFLVVGNDPPQTGGGATWMTTVLETACLRNVFPDLKDPWAIVSMESIAARDPDWLLTSQGKTPGQRLAEFRSQAGWRELRAVRAGRVLEIPGDLFSRSGPTIPDAARAIVAARRQIEGK